MHKAITPLIRGLKSGLEIDPLKFSRVRLHFIGTSYASEGQGKQTILPLAKQYGVEDYVVEITDRISYFYTLVTLQNADALFIPGSDDPKYTASKIYPYLSANKITLAIFNSHSPAMNVLKEYGVKHSYHYDDPALDHKVNLFLNEVSGREIPEISYNASTVDKYSAKSMTLHQCALFNEVLAARYS